MIKILMMPLILFCFAIVATSCSAIFAIGIETNTYSNSHGLLEIMPFDECDMPCLFGTSLNGLSYAEIQNLLENHPLTYDASFEYDTNRIKWIWSNRARSLISQKFSKLPYYDDLNFVEFEKNRVSKIGIVFGYSLADIIDIYGNKFIVYPYIDAGLAGTTYALEYPELEGWFIVSKRCENPYLTPNTFVVSYIYMVNDEPYYVKHTTPPEDWTGNPDDWFEPVHWSDYQTEIQSCSAFVPG